MTLGNQQPPQQSRHMASPYGKPSSHLEHEQQQLMLAMVRRNARERNRIKQLNNGFSQLRQQLPVAIIAELSNGRRGIGPGANKRLSKVSTLRMAVEYIRRLQRLIYDNDRKQQQQQQRQLHSQQHCNYQQQLQQQQQFCVMQQQLQFNSPSSTNSSTSFSSSSSPCCYHM